MSDSDFMIEDDLPPKVPPKNYAVQMKSFRTAVMFGGKARKLVMEFVIVEPGEYFGKEIPKYCNVTRIIGRPQQGGRFKVSPTGTSPETTSGYCKWAIAGSTDCRCVRWRGSRFWRVS